MVHRLVGVMLSVVVLSGCGSAAPAVPSTAASVLAPTSAPTPAATAASASAPATPAAVMPSLVGLSEQAAVALLAADQLGARFFRVLAPSASAPSGTVTAQGLSAGAPIPETGLFSFTVSTGPLQLPPPPSPLAGPPLGINAVPLLPGGKMETDIREISIYNGTVVAVDRSPDGTVKDFAITIAGKRIGRTCPDIQNNVCSYSGATLWLNVTSTTRLASPDHMIAIGQGPAAVSEYIVVGREIPWMIIPIADSQLLRDLNADVPGNLASLKELNSSIGKSLPRANRSFVFSSIGIALE